MNSSSSSCNDSDFDISTTFTSQILFWTFLPLQCVIALCGAAANSMLCYAQTRVHNWPFYQRLLAFNVTVAAILASTLHFAQALYHIVMRASGRSPEELHWIHTIGDSAQTAVVFSMAAICLRSFVDIRRCSRNDKSTDERSVGIRRKAFGASVVIISIWILATTLISCGLNPQADIDNDEEKTSAEGTSVLPYVSFSMHMLIQMIVVLLLVCIRRYSSRLQVDFAHRGAHQDLRTRTYIKETIDLTGTLTSILALHITCWLLSLILAFVLMRAMSTDDDCRPESTDLTAYTSSVECVTLAFDLGYPIMIMAKQRQIRHVVLRMFRPRSTEVGATNLAFVQQAAVKANGGGSGSAMASVRSANVPTPGRIHHDAIDDHWRQIAAVRKLALAG